MKKKINVIDLDKTLISFDSFKKFVLVYIFRFNFNVIILSIFRYLNLINAYKFKKKFIYIIEKTDSIYDDYVSFATMLLNNLNQDVIELVNENSFGGNIINILCSASPNGYVQKLASKLGWVGYGSGYYKKKFVHLYGNNKIEFIKKHYPVNKYIYNYAISDSESDLNLLKMFNKYDIYKKHK